MEPNDRPEILDRGRHQQTSLGLLFQSIYIYTYPKQKTATKEPKDWTALQRSKSTQRHKRTLLTELNKWSKRERDSERERERT